MITRLLLRWEELRGSYWFVPTVMAILAAALSVTMLELDSQLALSTIEGLRWLYTGGAEGARTVLSTIASSMITVAGVTFSIAVTALVLASQQFGPRLLRNFMRDTGNQVVLGTFIAAFLYCLLVLRVVRGSNGGEFIPYLSVTVGVALALAGVAVLIYFIHHIAQSIQVTMVIAEVGRELDATITRLFPDRGDEDAQPPQPDAALLAAIGREACPVPSSGSGYLQAIDDGTLLGAASRHDLVVRLAFRPGQFIVRGAALAWVWPGQRLNDEVERQVRQALNIGQRRTLTQDVEFAVDQLVEVAARALSPGINDPFTAIRCIDQLADALCRLASRAEPSPYRYDDAGRLRIIQEATHFDSVVDAAFTMIRQYGANHVAVQLRLLEAITAIADQCARQPAMRAALQRQARMIVERSRAAGLVTSDLRDIEERYQAAVQVLLRTEAGATAREQ